MKSTQIDTEHDKRVLDPETVEPVLLDRLDRHAIEEALLWFAEEKEHREEWSEYFEHLAWVITDTEK